MRQVPTALPGAGCRSPIAAGRCSALGSCFSDVGDVASVGKEESSVSQKISSSDNFSVPFVLCFVSGLFKLGKLRPEIKYELIQYECTYLSCGIGRLSSVNSGYWHFIISSCSSR